MPTPSERTAAFNAERRSQLKRLPRIQRDVVFEVERQLIEAAQEVEQLLARAGAEWRRNQLQALQREIELALDAWRKRAEKTAGAGMEGAWSAGADLVVQPLAAGGVSFAPRLNLGALSALEHALTDRIVGISTRAVDRINAEIVQVLTGTRQPAQAITNVQRILGGSARRRARTIVYDELGRAYARASQDTLSQATSRLPGLKKRWLHSGKQHPRPAHVAAHGQVVPVNDPFIVAGEALMYPRDPNGSASNTINCGCFSIPVTDGSTWGFSTVRLDPSDALTGLAVELQGERIPLPG